MRWTPRQQALLQAMGVRSWWPTPSGDAPAAGPALRVRATVASDAAPAPAAAAVVLPVASAAEMKLPRPPAQAPMSAPASVRASAPASVLAPGDVTHRARTEAMDWPALAEAVAGCTACGLCQQRRQTVFGVGHPRAHWLIVGEAPGEQEDRQGEPFVGPAGQLLDAMLRALGLGRADGPPAQQVYITNTLKCRPPGNRNPSAEELAQCLPFLQRQIDLVQPRLILAMGRFAVQALLQRDEPIGRLRGQVHRRGDTPVIVTYHPSYLLRSPGEKARAWEDLCLAADTMDAIDIAESQGPRTRTP